MRVRLQNDLWCLLHKALSAERTNLVVAEHRSAKDDAQNDVVRLPGLSQNAMQFLQQCVGNDGGAFHCVDLNHDALRSGNQC
ncbi:MAG TPA: hypothetical protein VD978_02415 [Azospirillum sp.]|nr:hypothetical protein [Azospirillum sp.]